MLKRFTYKQRNVGLLILTLVFGYLIYGKAIKGTLALANDCAKLEEQLSLASSTPEELQLLKAELEQVNQVVRSDLSVQEAHQQLLEQLSRFCDANALHLKEFPEPHRFASKDFSIITSSAEIEGGYAPLVQLVNELEQHPKGFKVTSVKFFTHTDNRIKKTNLYAKIYFQNIRKA